MEIWLAVLLGCAASATAAELVQSATQPSEPTNAAVHFRWAIGAFEGDGKGIIPIERDITLSTNAAIAMLVEPKSACHIYILIETADGEFEWHFPHRSPKEARSPAAQIPHYIPPPPMGLRLSDHPSNSKVYLFASAQPLTMLEAAFLKYENAAPEGKNLSASDLINELRQLTDKSARASHRQTEGVKLALRTGDTSGVPDKPELDAMASEITAERFFAQTVLIRTR